MHLSKRFLKLRLPLFVLVSATILPGQTVNVDNKLANGYSYDPFPEDCPNGHPVANIRSGYHIERPHAIYNSSTNT